MRTMKADPVESLAYFQVRKEGGKEGGREGEAGGRTGDVLVSEPAWTPASQAVAAELEGGAVKKSKA